MWLLGGCWDSLAPTPHCVTTGRLAAATKTRARIIPVQGFMPDALPATTLPISGLGAGTEYAGLHTPRLDIHTYKKLLEILSSTNNPNWF